MSRKVLFHAAFAVFACSLGAATLSPGTPVPIVCGGTVSTTPNVAGTSGGFMAAWMDNSSQVVASFSSDLGQSWSSPFIIANNSSYLVNVCAKNNLFITSWVNVGPGFSTGNAYISRSTNQGQIWSVPQQISSALAVPGGTVNPPVAIAASEDGFMACWTSPFMGTTTVWSAFSSDGSVWNAPVQVNLLNTASTTNSVTGNSSGYLIGFNRFVGMGNRGYVSFSGDHGATWGAPVEVTPSIFNNVMLSVAANASGFMAVWVDPSFNGYASFSTDNGATWGSPVLIATNVFNPGAPPSIMLSANNDVFVASWADTMHNAKASITSDNGATWSAPVAITMNNAVYFAGYNAFVGVAVSQSHCMFTWKTAMSNGYSSYSTVPFTPEAAGMPSPSGCFKAVTPNRPGTGLFK